MPEQTLRLTFAKGKVEYETDTLLQRGIYTLKEATRPRQLDLRLDGWSPVRAIYRFEKGRLTLAFPNGLLGERPKDFTSADSKKIIHFLERARPDEAGPGNADQAKMRRARLECGGRLQRIVLAMHRYIDEHGSFPPPAITDRQGKPLLSWRVALLPYLGEKELYEQFHLDEPWDSEHNRPLLEKLPKLYASVLNPPKVKGGTFYQGFTGEGCLFEPGKEVALEDIPDGTVNTIAVVAAAGAVPWTKPADLPYSADKPLPSFVGGMIEDGLVSFATADGSVYATSNTFSGAKEQVFRAAITRNGGEPIHLGDLNK